MVWFRGGTEPVEGTLFRIDHLVWYTRGLSLSAGILLVLVLWNQIDDDHSAEAYACLLVILAGTSLVAASNDLVSLFLSLEMVSIPTYVILYLPRRDRSGGEATLKYFLLSVFSSALVLYGMSWLFGAAGTTNFTAIQQVLASRAARGRGTGGNCVCADAGRFVLPDHGRAVSLLRAGRVSRHDGGQRGAAFVHSENRRFHGADCGSFR